MYETIAGMSEAASREVADVRIYGDNDDETPPDPNGKGGGGRWQHFVDPEKPNDPFNTRNLYDRFNGVLRSAGGQGVRPVAGMCYSTPMRLGSGGDYYAEKLQHSRDRAVITVSFADTLRGQPLLTSLSCTVIYGISRRVWP